MPGFETIAVYPLRDAASEQAKDNQRRRKFLISCGVILPLLVVGVGIVSWSISNEVATGLNYSYQQLLELRMFHQQQQEHLFSRQQQQYRSQDFEASLTTRPLDSAARTNATNVDTDTDADADSNIIAESADASGGPKLGAKTRPLLASAELEVADKPQPRPQPLEAEQPEQRRKAAQPEQPEERSAHSDSEPEPEPKAKPAPLLKDDTVLELDGAKPNNINATEAPAGQRALEVANQTQTITLTFEPQSIDNSSASSQQPSDHVSSSSGHLTSHGQSHVKVQLLELAKLNAGSNSIDTSTSTSSSSNSNSSGYVSPSAKNQNPGSGSGSNSGSNPEPISKPGQDNDGNKDNNNNNRGNNSERRIANITIPSPEPSTSSPELVSPLSLEAKNSSSPIKSLNHEPDFDANATRNLNSNSKTGSDLESESESESELASGKVSGERADQLANHKPSLPIISDAQETGMKDSSPKADCGKSRIRKLDQLAADLLPSMTKKINSNSNSDSNITAAATNNNYNSTLLKHLKQAKQAKAISDLKPRDNNSKHRAQQQQQQQQPLVSQQSLSKPRNSDDNDHVGFEAIASAISTTLEQAAHSKPSFVAKLGAASEGDTGDIPADIPADASSEPQSKWSAEPSQDRKRTAGEHVGELIDDMVAGRNSRLSLDSLQTDEREARATHIVIVGPGASAMKARSLVREQPAKPEAKPEAKPDANRESKQTVASSMLIVEPSPRPLGARLLGTGEIGNVDTKQPSNYSERVEAIDTEDSGIIITALPVEASFEQPDTNSTSNQTNQAKSRSQRHDLLPAQAYERFASIQVEPEALSFIDSTGQQPATNPKTEPKLYSAEELIREHLLKSGAKLVETNQMSAKDDEQRVPIALTSEPGELEMIESTKSTVQLPAPKSPQQAAQWGEQAAQLKQEPKSASVPASDEQPSPRGPQAVVKRAETRPATEQNSNSFPEQPSEAQAKSPAPKQSELSSVQYAQPEPEPEAEYQFQAQAQEPRPQALPIIPDREINVPAHLADSMIQNIERAPSSVGYVNGQLTLLPNVHVPYGRPMQPANSMGHAQPAVMYPRGGRVFPAHGEQVGQGQQQQQPGNLFALLHKSREPSRHQYLAQQQLQQPRVQHLANLEAPRNLFASRNNLNHKFGVSKPRLLRPASVAIRHLINTLGGRQETQAGSKLPPVVKGLGFGLGPGHAFGSAPNPNHVHAPVPNFPIQHASNARAPQQVNINLPGDESAGRQSRAVAYPKPSRHQQHYPSNPLTASATATQLHPQPNQQQQYSHPIQHYNPQHPSHETIQYGDGLQESNRQIGEYRMPRPGSSGAYGPPPRPASPAVPYHDVADHDKKSKGLTFHFGGGPIGGGTQLVTSPLGILKHLMLPLLPNPKINLNGKVVFGVVLEKNPEGEYQPKRKFLWG